MSNKTKPTYPDNVEFATPPSDTKEARKTTAYKRFEAFCRGELKAKNYNVIETRTKNGLSVAVYNQDGKLMGHFDSVINAHKALI